jgi:hypothetical protein
MDCLFGLVALSSLSMFGNTDLDFVILRYSRLVLMEFTARSWYFLAWFSSCKGWG